ncbi:7907_t:CDS:2 [Acaulospora morrowiae]|uniref:Adenosine kinase n=1 Tax=Acaulospora morrowiae TaxID=94023 RepID=A0A9N8VHU0_9GLOM|nr:7907_t:CDS:2 [Acaulospora morrowiae]
MSQSTHVLFCMGNPLLDISVNADTTLLKKYDLKANDSILAEEKHKPLYEELINNYTPAYVAGGATQNTARGAQYLLPPNSVIYFGCVGSDQYADQMRKAAGKEGLTVDYLVDNEHPTGTCAVVITDLNRSLVANLSAAEQYKDSKHLDLPGKWKIVENAKYYYIGGFFLTVSPSAILKVARHAAENNKPFMMNLSAPFLCQAPPFKKVMSDVLPYWDIIFGNESEAEAFAVSENWKTTDLKEIALKIAQLPKVNTKRPRVVIITHGAQPTVVAYQETGKVVEIPTCPIADKDIVDTNGAGDSFVGGFLSQYITGKSIEESVKVGHWLANHTIRLDGPTYPEEKLTYPGSS